MSIKLYKGDTLIAEQIDENTIKDTGTGLDLPFGLFGIENEGTVSVDAFKNWAKRNIFPETKNGIKAMLKEMGIDVCDEKFLLGKTEEDTKKRQYWVEWDNKSYNVIASAHGLFTIVYDKDAKED